MDGYATVARPAALNHVGDGPSLQADRHVVHARPRRVEAAQVLPIEVRWLQANSMIAAKCNFSNSVKLGNIEAGPAAAGSVNHRADIDPW
jgi:hypothetical protein